MVIENLIIEILTKDSVNILTQYYQDNKQLGENHRKAYINSQNGRLELEELPENVKNAILNMWGTASTVTKNIII